MTTPSLTRGIDLEAITTRQDFADALTAVREAAGMTVRQVARATGIHPSTVGGYYSGRHLPPLRPDVGVQALLRACGVGDPGELAAWQRTLARIRRPSGPRPGALPPPWTGLHPYGEADANRLPGRQDEVRALHRLVIAGHDRGGLTVLLGDAGTGKSSLLRAGLVPLLRAAPGDRPVAVLVPGREPLRALAAALAGPAGTDAALAELRRAPARARDLAASRLGDTPDGTGFAVLVVDQLEDLFVPAVDAAEREAFVAALAATCRPGACREAPPASVVVALRTGFLSRAARHADLAVALRAGDGPPRTLHLPAPTADQVRAVVLEPARTEGLDLEEALVRRVLADADAVPPPVLPRLGHALAATWRAARHGRLTLGDHLAVGGVAGSIEAAAEAAYLPLPPAARRAAEDLLPRLFTVLPEGVLAAPAAPVDDRPATRAAVTALAAAGLVAVDGAGVRAVSGCLPDCWPRLARWLGLAPDAEPPDAEPPPGPAPDAAWWAWRWAAVAVALALVVGAGVWWELHPGTG